MAEAGITRVASAILFSVACLGLAHGCARDEQPQINEPKSLSGVWWTESYSPTIQLEGGGELPYTEEGRTRAAANAAALAADPLSDEARKFCLPDGVPRILGNPYPFQIIQTPGWATIVYELNRVVRRIEMDAMQREDEWLELFPYYSGHSVGRWDGDTLVIETAGYNDKTFLDATGAPHSDKMRTTERLRKLANDQLEIVITITDPATYSAPLTARYTYKLHPGLRLEDYNCGEAHRDISHIPGVVVPN